MVVAVSLRVCLVHLQLLVLHLQFRRPRLLARHGHSVAAVLRPSAFGLKENDYGRLLSMIYLKLSLTDFITIFAARTRGFFFTRRPGNALLVAFVALMRWYTEEHELRMRRVFAGSGYLRYGVFLGFTVIMVRCCWA